ncbi:MAG TPA: hypothetical protein DCR43_04085 [Bacteroidales bacterium]|nr:MAG: hypothetical protein A2X11_01425 [Bacteroidetes bacterium GWE2_42_24]OFY27353.1 MAG: hypothetical protein A2X09_00630 [Bacteroidetes bacterium GWF2_43_11]PKP26944.1 MAG: hypothetical protein CVU06_03275 [Bacteroidetes bacterium HGW-Bacteroidetes-22]HAQ65022.1 hypothetical protein [Bacteroidales bacterium]HBZ65896.1 hypothetical protein [Bacteroidales bacterium]
MKNRLFSILVFLFSAFVSLGQSITITGSVHTLGMNGVEAWPVTIASQDGVWPYVHELVYTDTAGHFIFTGQVSDSILLLTVSTPDCNQQTVDTTFVISPGESAHVSLVICDSFPVSCDASYVYSQSPDSTSTDTFLFINTSTGSYSLLLWDFGDGTTSSELSPIHTFSPGEWNVCLVISDPINGCSDAECKSLVVHSAEPCTNDFTAQAVDLGVTFTGWASSAGYTSFSWDFGDGASGTGASASHLYVAGGAYLVSLTTINEDTCTAVSSHWLTVGQQSCEARYQWEIDPSDQLTVHFSDASVGSFDLWNWKFGDGQTSSMQHPEHIYTQAGTYQVCLTVISSDSLCLSTVCQSVTVGDLVYFTVFGQVLANLFPADEIDVRLFESTGGVPVLADSAYVTTQGAFAFYAVPTGNYLLKGSLMPGSALYDQFLPTYSGNTVLWEEAATFGVNQPIGGADINLVPIPEATSGNGSINGLVQQEGGLKESGTTAMSGIPVYLFTMQHQLVQAVYTSSDGSFSFQGVLNGSYVVRPEITGLPVTPFLLTIGNNTTTAQYVVFTVSVSGIHYGIDNELPSGISGVSVPYPNPATDKVFFDIVTTTNMTLTISLADQSGRIVCQHVAQLQSGSNNLWLNTANLPAGLYGLVLRSDDNVPIVRKVMIM